MLFTDDGNRLQMRSPVAESLGAEKCTTDDASDAEDEDVDEPEGPNHP